MIEIYGLTDPRTDKVRYVGKTVTTTKQRLAGHISETRAGRASRKNAWIAGLLDAGLKPGIVVLATVDDGRKAEEEWISRFPDLLNVYPGGGGPGKGHLKGIKKSPEHARLLRERLAKYKHNCKGRIQSPTERDRKSAASRKRWGRGAPPTMEDIRGAVSELGKRSSVRAVARKLGCSYAYVYQMPEKKYGIAWKDLKNGTV